MALGRAVAAAAIVAQTEDRRFAGLDAAWFPALRFVYDGRNSMRDVVLPDGAVYAGVGVQDATRAVPATAAGA